MLDVSKGLLIIFFGVLAILVIPMTLLFRAQASEDEHERMLKAQQQLTQDPSQVPHPDQS